MGNQKLKWTSEEEETLKAGVAKYGAGKWKSILADSDLKLKLANRSNVDLKDKWRNLGVTFGQGSGAQTMTTNGQATEISVPPPKTENSTSVFTRENQSSGRVKYGPTYTEMILEALSSIKDRKGSGFSSILEFIEKKYDVPQNFRRTLSTKLRKLIMQGKLEKVHKRYKIKQASLAIKKHSLKQKAVTPKPIQKPRLCFSAKAVEVAAKTIAKHRSTAKAVEDAAKTIAKHIAEAEHRSSIAAEAITEYERISRMVDDSDAVVMHLSEIIEQLEKTKQKSPRAAEAINESKQVARMAEDSDASIMRLNEIFRQWEKAKQTSIAPKVTLSGPSFT